MQGGKEMDNEELNGCTGSCGSCGGCGSSGSEDSLPILVLTDENGKFNKNI